MAQRSLSQRLKSLARRALGRPARGPRVIPAALGIEGFFTRLRDSGVRYVVLRWFDRLPDVRPGSDVDLLVHDDDVAKVEALLIRSGQGTKCDLYGVGGRHGTDWREVPGAPYLPQARAEALVENAELRRGLYRVPTPEDHFLSLAYHAVYQKGPKSGLPSRHASVVPDSSPKHDHTTILTQLGREAGIDVPIDMESLDEYLAQRGWRPSDRALAALRPRNPWIEAHFFASQPGTT